MFFGLFHFASFYTCNGWKSMLILIMKGTESTFRYKPHNQRSNFNPMTIHPSLQVAYDDYQQYIRVKIMWTLIWYDKGTCTSLLCHSDGTINRGIFGLHMHSIWQGIKRSWHSMEGGSVTVGVEKVSVTYRQPACTVKMKMNKCKCWQKEEKIWMSGQKEEKYEWVDKRKKNTNEKERKEMIINK